MAWQPSNWKIIYQNIKKMRSSYDAPVDIMGCERCGDINASDEVFRFQTLVSLMLSSQTKDQITYAAMKRLIDHGLTVENILMTSDEVLGNLIYPVGFWKKKIIYIKRTSEILREKYNCDIPSSVNELISLPGVGPKMAYICMNAAWVKSIGIGVDTHVHRITNRIGWSPTPCKNPEDTRKALEDWLPPSLWSEVNSLLVGFGQQICTPLNPHCHACLNKTICPFGSKVEIKKESLKRQIKTESEKKSIKKVHLKTESEEKNVKKVYLKTENDKKNVKKVHLKTESEEKNVKKVHLKTESDEKNIEKVNLKTESEEKIIEKVNSKGCNKYGECIDMNASNNASEETSKVNIKNEIINDIPGEQSPYFKSKTEDVKCEVEEIVKPEAMHDESRLNSEKRTLRSAKGRIRVKYDN